MANCAECGANLALVGRRHRCIPKTGVSRETFVAQNVNKKGQARVAQRQSPLTMRDVLRRAQARAA